MSVDSSREAPMNAESVQFLKEKINYLQKSLPAICQDYLLWRGCPQMPYGAVRPHIVTSGDCVYVGGGNSGQMEYTRTVMKYEIHTNQWSSLPITAFYTFSMVLLKGLVTVVGGCNVITACVSDTLTSYEESSGKWGVQYPPMPTRRCASSAVSTSSHLVVVGGISDSDSAYLDVVEVLDVSSMEWSTVCPFPKAVTFMSITACSVTGRMFLLGGLSREGAMRSIFSCKVSDLVGSSGSSKDNVWQVITDCPYFRSGGAAIGGKLVIASGIDAFGEVTSALHSFDPATDKWREVGEMPSARSSCSIGVLPGGQVLLAGGYFKPKNWIGSLTKDVMATVNLHVT